MTTFKRNTLSPNHDKARIAMHTNSPQVLEYTKPNRYQLLKALLESTHFYSTAATGGAHTDVLSIDEDLLLANLKKVFAANLQGSKLSSQCEEWLNQFVTSIANRYLVKRGKIEEFSMPLLGAKENRIPRSLMSHAFGPVGYSLLPTVEKLLIDASEAVRQLPYLAYGQLADFVAPDIIETLYQHVTGKQQSDQKQDSYVVFLEAKGDKRQLSIYDLLKRDPYFTGEVQSREDLITFQQFVRKNPLTKEVESDLAEFFEAPITVGARDTLRWILGSRHPKFGWETAKKIILECFEKCGNENFLPAEIIYYAPDTGMSTPEFLQKLRHNTSVARLFAQLLKHELESRGFRNIKESDLVSISWALLEFHHGYPIYDIEPYVGLVSLATAKLAARVVVDFVRLMARFKPPQKRNLDVMRLLSRPGTVADFAATLSPEELSRWTAALSSALQTYLKGKGIRDSNGKLHEFIDIPYTFYSVQELAHSPFQRQGKILDVFTLEHLYDEDRVGYLNNVPELGDKLVVFFTLVYRYYKDTGFACDLRPRRVGRDVFIFGIWGYVTDNVVITVWQDNHGEKRAGVKFVDNKDQFKRYERSVDRTYRPGMGKLAMRLVEPLVRPALLRSVGLFTDAVYRREQGSTVPARDIKAMLSRAIDMAHEVSHDAVKRFFAHTTAFAEDSVDDLFEGVRSLLGLSGSKKD